MIKAKIMTFSTFKIYFISFTLCFGMSFFYTCFAQGGKQKSKPKETHYTGGTAQPGDGIYLVPKTKYKRKEKKTSSKKRRKQLEKTKKATLNQGKLKPSVREFTTEQGTKDPGNINLKKLEKEAKKSQKKDKHGLQHEGNISAKKLKKEQKKMERKAAKAASYEGDYKVKRKIHKKDLHPSSLYVLGHNKKSYKAKERVRKRKVWWFQNSKILRRMNKNDFEQPKHLKEKPIKPKYDKNEREIWND